MSQALNLKVLQQGQGFPILCLHGHPGSGECMGVFCEPLSRQFLTLAPDLRGYGGSHTQEEFTMMDHLADLERLLDQHHISRCLVLGWSLGGILALELALRVPDRISGLILIATSASPRSKHPPVTWQDELWTGVASILNWLQPGRPWHIEYFGKRSLYRYLIQRHHQTAYQYLAKAALPAYLKTSGRAKRALSQALRSGYDRHGDLKEIKCPALILAAEQDYHITLESSLMTARELEKGTWQSYANAGHLFPWEIPTQVLQDIEGWIQSNPHLTR
ncbi:alpha/beta hydrolase [Leptolyngbya sp. 'hensonii']|uniref:alpha/beta fold hydrolase n=1 Tax=Leptolyngbya sp. 'hensonii' TaxID=1922337 RepID=UPI0009F83F91|nr:alpha/beta hydrolase [Leptolyngbya sp. 'hensonii']